MSFDEDKFKRIRRRQERTYKETIFDLWDKYQDKIEYVLAEAYEPKSRYLSGRDLFNLCKRIKQCVSKDKHTFEELHSLFYDIENSSIRNILGKITLSPGIDQDDLSYEQVPEDVAINYPRRNKFDSIDTIIDLPISLVQHPTDKGGLIDPDKVVTLNDKFNQTYNTIPSVDRSRRQYELMTNTALKYDADPRHFKPLELRNIYDPSIAKKHIGPRHTWMFDIINFSDHAKNNKEQALFLVGININTRYAVGKRIREINSRYLINIFEEFLKKVNIKSIIFDGQPGIRSKEFLTWAVRNKLKVRITASKIHTQTGPIDRLCRTLRRYWMKWYIINDKRYDKFANTLPFKINHNELTSQMLQYRNFFDKKTTKYISQIPRRYNLIGDEINFIKVYDRRGMYDEFEDLIEFYNHKPHNGIKRILDDARLYYPISSIRIGKRGKEVVKDINQITPADVEYNPGIEMIIVKYCNDYNKGIVAPKRKIDDKVRIYDVVQNHGGSLQPRTLDIDPNVYIINNVRGGYYQLQTKDGKNKVNVSKYMISKN